MPAIYQLTNRADIYIIYHQLTDYTNMPIIPITIILIYLQPKYD